MVSVRHDRSPDTTHSRQPGTRRAVCTCWRGAAAQRDVEFNFPIDGGTLGWIYLDPEAIPVDGHVHSGIDAWPVGGDGSPIYALADGYVSRTTNSHSFDIVYTNTGVESYTTHVRHSLSPGDAVSAGQVIAVVDGPWVHMSIGAIQGYDDRVIAQTQDPSSFFGADLNYDSGARNPLPYDRPLSTFCTTVAEAVPSSDPLCDDFKDSVDSLVLLQFSAGLLASPPCLERADVNGDGSVDALDAALILQYVAGFLP
jgi:hypothetical protein